MALSNSQYDLLMRIYEQRQLEDEQRLRMNSGSWKTSSGFAGGARKPTSASQSFAGRRKRSPLSA